MFSLSKYVVENDVILYEGEWASRKATFFFLYIQFTLFQTTNLQSPGTYISKRT